MNSSNLIEDRIIELEKFEIFKEGYFKDIQVKIFSSKKNNNYQIIVSKLNETEISELSINYIKTLFLKYIGLNLQNFVWMEKIESIISVNKMSYKYTNYTNKIYNKDTLKNLEKIKNELSDLKNIEIDDFDIHLKRKNLSRH